MNSVTKYLVEHETLESLAREKAKLECDGYDGPLYEGVCEALGILQAPEQEKQRLLAELAALRAND